MCTEMFVHIWYAGCRLKLYTAQLASLPCSAVIVMTYNSPAWGKTQFPKVSLILACVLLFITHNGSHKAGD